MEEWRSIPIEEYKYYEVSTKGNVRLVPRDIEIKDGNTVTIKHIEGRSVSVYKDKNTPVFRIRGTNNVLKKFSLPLIMLKIFKSDEVPLNIAKCIAHHKDGNAMNNDINNLEWVSMADNISNMMSKYRNIIIKVNDEIVGYAETTGECERLFNKYGFKTAASSVGRAIDRGTLFFYVFRLDCVTDEEFEDIRVKYNLQDLMVVQRKVLNERAIIRRNENNAIQRQKRKEAAKNKPIKAVKEKKPKPVKEKKNEEVKEKKKVLVNDRTTNIKKTKSKEIKTAKPKNLIKINKQYDWDLDDSGFFIEQENKRKEFKDKLSKLLRRINNE